MTISKKDMEEIKNALKSSAKQCQREWLESLNKPIIPLSLDTPSEFSNLSEEEAEWLYHFLSKKADEIAGTDKKGAMILLKLTISLCKSRE